jgi:dTDP-4-dehydrorhamnose reductase
MSKVIYFMKILITGAKGQLGQELVRLSLVFPNGEIVGFDRKKLDVTNLEECYTVIHSYKPNAIIHCAAYTKVDQAESEANLAFRINAEGTRNVALAAEQIGAKIIYISTDYVFDGKASSPYREDDLPNPLSVYGKSKLVGEQFVRSLCSYYFIVRTSWIFGRYGHNFVKTMLKLEKERDVIKVVDDQVGSPTYALDLARFLLKLVRTEHYGIWHASNTGSCSWYEFARAVFEEKRLNVRVEPCTSADFQRLAPRPAYSVLAHEAIRYYGLEPFRPWREALRDFLRDNEY